MWLMNSYIDIKVLYDKDEKRSVSELAKLYTDRDLLKDAVTSVMSQLLRGNKLQGKKVLLKPNFVDNCHHENDDICKITNLNLLLATIKVILEYNPASIVVGDAPIQDCIWSELLPQSFLDDIKGMSEVSKIPILVVDFRKVVCNPTKNGSILRERSQRMDSDYLEFDLERASWLEPVTNARSKFRVSNYDPSQMKKSHSKGVHKYCIAKEIFDADIIITMPKPKTHRMACLTNSLKILVGINGDKDCLPHHRIGATSHGGDCYKDYSLLRTVSEYLIDLSNKYRKPRKIFMVFRELSIILWRMSKPNQSTTANAGWYGNDTVWRMVMDINHIATYGKKDGTIADTPQRTIYSLCDAIIGGQGNGPLNPDPLALGFLAFTNDPYAMDEAMGRIFNLDISKVPLLREAQKLNCGKNIDIRQNGIKMTSNDLLSLKVNPILPSGWSNYNK